jgi:hypothetical protein
MNENVAIEHDSMSNKYERKDENREDTEAETQ